ncbi:hypothetical protein SeMB42_g07873 [Synchytrium endobioticum]|uniref:Glutaredoxin-like protein n=1 Tax=Synchytrium endobioticum TaxID=286115 RepID=A0A507C8T9_9FUNG|nr:hypothetical protein SeMB42_g07873 [Synchytrium endobioticum]TPX34406.1 hypothetical protein SeLEV6574_g08292 [Synchytrium endobioticum]
MAFRSARHVVTLFTKAGQCSLCDEAKHALLRLRKQVDFELKEVDILERENAEFRRLYQYDIPVIHVNGKPAQKHRVVEEKLYRLLTQS